MKINRETKDTFLAELSLQELNIITALFNNTCLSCVGNGKLVSEMLGELDAALEIDEEESAIRGGDVTITVVDECLMINVDNVKCG